MPAVTRCFLIKQNHIFERAVIGSEMYSNFQAVFERDAFMLKY